MVCDLEMLRAAVEELADRIENREPAEICPWP
jgi:hypothetical protein